MTKSLKRSFKCCTANLFVMFMILSNKFDQYDWALVLLQLSILTFDIVLSHREVKNGTINEM